MSEDQSDRTFEATEQKLRRARQEGDIPRSQEANAALLYLGFWGALALMGATMVPGWLRMAARTIGAEPWPDKVNRTTADLGWATGGYAALSALAAIALMGLCVLLGMIAQRTIVFTPKKLSLDFSRIDPLKNAKQKFGKSGLVGFGISLGKAGLVIASGWILFGSLLVMLSNADRMGGGQWVSGLGVILGRVTMLAVGISALFAVVDLLWKYFDHRRRNRMSRKEMMDEFKESEGDPHMKANRRQRAVDIVMNQMLADVEKADVVLVNPTHYAVALQWKRGSGRAPVCLAKGIDEVAARIRGRAAEHNIPVWPDPPATRAIYALVDIGAEIRNEHFAPVAAAIRFAEAMRRKARDGWGGDWRPDGQKGRK